MSSSKPMAMKWLGMKKSTSNGQSNQNDSTDDQMVVNQDVNKVLRPLDDRQINLVSIFGAARQGKSFLMNLLANQQNLFKISNLREPCTQGVDLSSHFMPLSEFESLSGNQRNNDSSRMIGFVDAEGQGDRDISYDSRLVSPVLLSSKVVIFNWKDSLQADRMLNLLAVLARAAQGVEHDAEDDDDSSKVFGHLHIVFRDWSFINTSPEEVFRDLFRPEKGRANEVTVRNQARQALKDAFQSINIWLFPAPVKDTDILSNKIQFQQLQPKFMSKLKELRGKIAQQLAHPMFFHKQPLTGKYLRTLIPALVQTLNSDDIIMPESVFTSMMRNEAQSMIKEYDQVIQDIREEIIQHEILMSVAEAKSSFTSRIDSLFNEIQLRLTKSIPGAELQKSIWTELGHVVEREEKMLDMEIERQVSEQLNVTFIQLKLFIESEMTLLMESLPMDPTDLKVTLDDIMTSCNKEMQSIPCSVDDIQDKIDQLMEIGSLRLERVTAENDKIHQHNQQKLQEQVDSIELEMSMKIEPFVESRFQHKQALTIAELKSKIKQEFEPYFKSEFPLETVGGQLLLKYFHELESETIRKYEQNMRLLSGHESTQLYQELDQNINKAMEILLPELLEMDEDEENQHSIIINEIENVVKKAQIKMSQALRGWSVPAFELKTYGEEIDRLSDKYINQAIQQYSVLRCNVKRHEVYQNVVKCIANEIEKHLIPQLPMDESTLAKEYHQLCHHQAQEVLVLHNKPAASLNQVQKRLEKDSEHLWTRLLCLNRSKSEAIASAKASEEEMKAALESQRKNTQEMTDNFHRTMQQKQETTHTLEERLQQQERETQELKNELEQMRLEKRFFQEKSAKEEQKRLEAEQFAQDAADAAEVSAQAAIAASIACDDSESSSSGSKKRNSEEAEIVDKDEDVKLVKRETLSSSSSLEEARQFAREQTQRRVQERIAEGGSAKKKTPLKSRSAVKTPVKAKPAKSVKTPGKSKVATPSAKGNVLEEARREAQLRIQRNIEERASKLTNSGKKKSSAK